MKTKNVLFLIMLTICLILSGCSKKSQETSVPGDISKTPPNSEINKSDDAINKSYPDSKTWEPDVIQRQFLFDEGYFAGVIFLGYVDGSMGDLDHNSDYYQSFFKEKGYLDSFPFLEDFPNSNFVQTEYGQELYCIIPRDETASVSVNQWIINEKNDYKGESGNVLYRSEFGSPILLKCNASEIMPDVEVLIVDKEGNKLQWCPSISGMDGHAVVESASGSIYDFTIYDNEQYCEPFDVLVGKTYDYHWSDEHEVTLASMTAPLVKLSEEAVSAYPELNTALNNNISARQTKLYNRFEDLIPMAEEFYPDFAEYFTEFEAKEEATIRRADSNVFSVLYKGTTYEGGVHGYYYYFGENYDTKSGELLELSDVVTDFDAIPSLVEEQLNQFWDPAYFYDDLDLGQYFKENRDNIAWTLDYHGITFFFNPYEIAPYASGIQVATVPFMEHPEVFAEKYVNGSESYGIQLNMETPFYFDVDANGSLDELIVLSEVTDDLIHVKHNIYLNGVWYDQSTFDNDDIMPEEESTIFTYEVFSPHLVYLADGRTYLFIENLEDSDFRTNTVYELTDGTVTMVETLYNSLHTEVTEESLYALTQALTNPYNFKLDTRTWVIGTHDGYMTYYIDDDGHTYSYDDYYTFHSTYSYKPLRDLELNLVDEYGTIGETILIESGDEMTYYRTDGSVFADFILSDGQIVRADLEWDEGSCLIDGTNVEDLFEGVVFAG